MEVVLVDRVEEWRENVREDVLVVRAARDDA
jgi:hypothetical protein